MRVFPDVPAACHTSSADDAAVLIDEALERAWPSRYEARLARCERAVARAEDKLTIL